MQWAKKDYEMGAQSLMLDALDHSKEEIRSHYSTYVNRLNTPLLVLCLIWPLALNTIQFSDPFVPGIEDNDPAHCPDCIENAYAWIIEWWVYLLATVLTLPFWGILMLIRCKLKLDSWLEYSLAGLSRERRRIVKEAQAEQAAPKNDAERMVAQLVTVVLEYQDYLARIWTAECGWLVHASTMILWMSALGSLLLTALSEAIFLRDKGGFHTTCSPYFVAFIIFGVIVPGVYVAYQRLFAAPVLIPEGLHQEEDDMYEYPLTSKRVQRGPSALRRTTTFSDSAYSTRSSGISKLVSWLGFGCGKRRPADDHLTPLMRANTAK